MTLGTNDKTKVAALIGLGLVAAYLFYTNVLSGPGASAPSAASAATSPAPLPAPPMPAAGTRAATPPRPRTSARSRGDDFHPVLHSTREEDRVDPMTVDPTLRLDLLAKLQAEPNAGGARNLFQFGQAPPPKAELPKGPEPKIMPNAFTGPRQPVTEAASARPPFTEPPPPPIAIKYYGYANTRGDGKKTAFFLDGDDVLVAGEGDTIKRRYRVVSIGVKSAVVEDIQSKRQQSVPLTEDPAGA